MLTNVKHMGGGKKCLVCGEALPHDNLITFDNMPSSAQNIPDKENLEKDYGINLNLKQCSSCGLVQLDCTPVDYYKKVIRAGGGSSTMQELRKDEYTRFIKKFHLKGKKILEVGCGAGEFLYMWDGFDVDAIGVEYNKDFVQKARKKGLNVINDFIDSPTCKLPGAPFDAFCQFNFLEHQPYPNEMLKGIYNNLTDEGVGLVTVPSLEYILKYDGYYELIRDHLAYYSKETLNFLFEKNGFEVVSTKTVNRDTHEIMVRKRSNIDLSYWNSSYITLKSDIEKFISDHNGNVAIWGASHQGFTLISSLKISNKIKYIIDSARFKQNKFAPASHVPIVSPEYFHTNPVSAIIIVAPGYTDEILRTIRTFYGSHIHVAFLKSNILEILN